MAKPNSQDTPDPESLLIAVKRSEILRRLASRARLTRAEVDAAADQLNLSRSQCYRLLTAFRQRPRTSTLLPKAEGRRVGSRLISPEIEAVIERAIQGFYLQRLKPPFTALVRQIQADCHQAGLKAPDRRTIHRRVSEIDEQKIVASRQGPKAARDRYTPVSREQSITKALEQVQIDHTPVDLIVVDEQTRKPLGRPWLTLAIDVASRVVCGFYLSMMPPSTVSVALALVHCVAPKDLWLADRDLTFEWPASGLPEVVHMDNAKELQTESLASAAIEYGIKLEYRPMGRPQSGGHIERLIGTMMGAVHLIPGTTFSSIAQRGSYASAKNAVMTLAELDRWLALQIHAYHSTIHSSLKCTPLAAWGNAIRARNFPISELADQRTFFLDLLRGERRKIRRDGIRLFNVHYWDNVLSPLAGRIDFPVLIKFDPRDLSTIYYRDDEGSYWPIPYRDLAAPPISIWGHRSAEAAMRAQGRRTFNEADLFATVRQQRDLIADSGRNTLKAARARTNTHRKKSEAYRQNEIEHDDLENIAVTPFKVEEWT